MSFEDLEGHCGVRVLAELHRKTCLQYSKRWVDVGGFVCYLGYHMIDKRNGGLWLLKERGRNIVLMEKNGKVCECVCQI